MRKVRPILQSAYAECGLACLAMVLQAYGRDVDLAGLRRRYGFDQRGLSFSELLRLAGDFGLVGRPMQVEPADLALLETPAILHWDFDHFVLLTNVRAGVVTIMDPSVGVRRLSLAECSRHLTGLGLEFEDLDNTRVVAAAGKIALRDLLPRGRAAARSAIPLLLLTIVLNITALTYPLYLQRGIDLAASGRLSAVGMALLLGGFCLVALLALATQLVRVEVLARFRSSLSAAISWKVFSKLLSARLEFFSARNTGTILAQYRSVGAITNTLSDQLVSRFVDGLAGALGIALVVAISPAIGTILSLSVGVYVALHAIFAARVRSALTEYVYADGRESSFLTETVTGIQAIRLYAAETARAGVFRNLHEGVEADARAYSRARGVLTAIQDAVLALTWLFIAYVGLMRHESGAVTLGQVTAVASWSSLVLARVREVAAGWVEFDSLRAHTARLEDILLEDGEAKAEPLAHPCAADGGDVVLEIKDLGFAYSSSSAPILQHCSLTLRRGEMACIIGESGAGKTTLLKILLGLCPAQDGEIRVGDLSGHQAVASLRGLASVVSQGDTLLMGTILENISFFDHEPDQDQVRRCARIAGVTDFVEQLPMKYDTILGQFGQGVSAGQQQKLLLARALYRSPRLLLLDEFSANLDEASERDIITRLRTTGVTILSIAHRPQVIALSDTVYRLEGGILHRGCRRPVAAGPIGTEPAAPESYLHDRTPVESRDYVPAGAAAI